MAITNAQQYKQLLEQGGRVGFQGGGADMGTVSTPGRAARDEGAISERMGRTQAAAEAARAERQKIAEKIQRPTTTFQKIARNPLAKTIGFFTNPVAMGAKAIFDTKRSKEINELFGIDDDLGYTGADFGFVNSLPTRPEMPIDRDGPTPIIPTMITTTPYQQDIIEEELSPIQQALLDRGPARRFAADGGIMNPNLVGGMMDGGLDEMGRQMYGLGKLVKKATRAVKKIAKSPIGQAALLYTGAAGLGALGAGTGFAGFKANFMSPTTLFGSLKKTGQNLGLLETEYLVFLEMEHGILVE
jgi:hypothetical protein